MFSEWVVNRAINDSDGLRLSVFLQNRLSFMSATRKGDHGLNIRSCNLYNRKMQLRLRLCPCDPAADSINSARDAVLLVLRIRVVVRQSS